MRRKYNGAKRSTEDAGAYTIAGMCAVEERSTRSEAKAGADVERVEVRMLA